MGSWTFLPPSSLNSQFLMGVIYFVTVCKELKIAKIAQINQLVQFLNLICANGDAFYDLTHMLMNINGNNDVSRFARSSSYSEKIISRHSYRESLLEEKKYYIRFFIYIIGQFLSRWSFKMTGHLQFYPEHFILRWGHLENLAIKNKNRSFLSF